MRTRPASLVASVLLALPLAAQIPANATALNPSFEAVEARLAQQGFAVHAAMRGNPPVGPIDYPVYYAGSTDGGRTWPVRDHYIGTTLRLNSFVVHDGSLLLLTARALTSPRLFRSTDGGATWSFRDVSAVASPALVVTSPVLHANGATIVVGWTGGANGHSAFVNRSTDGGVTWQPADTPLDNGGSASPYFDQMQFVAANGALHAFFASPWVAGPATWHNVSTDDGATWLPAATLVANDPFAAVAAVGSTLFLAGALNGTLVRSTNGGTTWQPVTGHGIPFPQSLAGEGQIVVAAGIDSLAGGPNRTNYVNVSIDGGTTWRQVPLALPTFTAFRPYAWTDGSTVLVYFTSFPSLSPVGTVVQSDDFGATWRAWAGPSEGGSLVGAERAIALTSWPMGTSPAPPNAFFGYVATGATSRGAGTPGAGGFVPALTETGLPTLGRTTTFAVAGIVGGTVGVLGFSLSAPAASTLGLGTNWLQGSIATHMFVAGGAVNQAGAGSHSHPFAVPNALVLVGMRFTSQAFALDSTVPFGFVGSNALETWMR